MGKNAVGKTKRMPRIGGNYNDALRYILGQYKRGRYSDYVALAGEPQPSMVQYATDYVRMMRDVGYSCKKILNATY